MFSRFGLSGTELEIATDSFIDWRDEDDTPKLRGAERETYQPRNITPRNGELRSVGELALINGVGRALADRIAPVATVNFGTNGDFDPSFASEIAIAVSADNEAEGEFEIAGVKAIASSTQSDRRSGPQDDLVGRPLTIRVEARGGNGSRAARQMIIELTGSTIRPYVVRARE